MRIVARSEESSTPTWSMLSYIEGEELFTFLEIITDGIERRHGGFGGPPVYDGQPINSWIGRLDNEATWVMVRATPQVSGVQAADSSGGRYTIKLQGPDPEFGLSFGCLAVPAGVEIVELITLPDGGHRSLFSGSL